MVRRFMMMVIPLALAPVLAFASDASWRTEHFNVVVRDQGVREVLTQFGALAGVPVVVSEAVDARMSARFEDAKGEDIFDAIAREYALDWRYDGRRIEVSAHSEQVSRILDMGGVASDELVGALEALDVYEAQFPISAIDGELGLLVGPPRYVAIVEIVLAELAEKQMAMDLADAERRQEQARQRAEAETRRHEEESLQLAEERRLRALQLAEESRLRTLRLAEEARLRALQASSTLVQRRQGPVVEVPLVNRGGRWGG